MLLHRIRGRKDITSVQTMIEPTAEPIALQAYIMGEDKTSSGQEAVVSMTEPVAPPPVVSVMEPVAPPPVVQDWDDNRLPTLPKNRISGR